MVFPANKATKVRKGQLDISEAFNLWAALRALNAAVENSQIWENYIHDPDFKYLLRKYIDNGNKDIKTIGEMMELYSIKGLDSHPAFVRTSQASEVMRDQYIASQLLISKQEIMEAYVRVTNTSITNDKLRRFFPSRPKNAWRILTFP